MFFRLVQAAIEKSSLEDICTSFEGCSADTVQYRMKKLDYSKTVQQINDMLRYTAQGFQIHKNKILTLAVDVTDYPWYGDRDHELSVGSKEKTGTLFFNRYFTACILTKTYRIPIYICPLRQEDGVSPSKLLESLIREIHWWCPFSRLLADAWFFSKDLFDLLDLYKIDYLFNLKRQRLGKQGLNQIKEMQKLLASTKGIDTTNPRLFFRWLKKHRLLTFKFKSIIRLRNQHRFPVVVQTVLVKKKKGRKPHKEYLGYYVYTTNISASGEYLKHLYKLRWGIETQYRVAHQFQAKTTSLCTNIRIMFIGLSFLLTSLWLRINLILNRIKSKKDHKLNYD
ncbi:MAG: transposase [Promethearchaeota archaeon]